MAVADMMTSRLRLVYYEGDDLHTGRPIYKYKSFNNVKTNATPEQLLAIAVAVAELQDYNLYNIERHDNSEIRQGQ